MLPLHPSRRIVQVPVGPLRFAGAVPASRVLVFDPSRGGWVLKRDNVEARGGCTPGAGHDAARVAPCPAAAAAVPGARDAPGEAPKCRASRLAGVAGARALALGALGALAGLGASVLVYRLGPVVNAGAGKLPASNIQAEGAVRLAVPAKLPAGPDDPGRRTAADPASDLVAFVPQGRLGSAAVTVEERPLVRDGAAIPPFPVPADMLARARAHARVADEHATGRSGGTVAAFDAVANRSSARNFETASPGRPGRPLPPPSRGRHAAPGRGTAGASARDADDTPILNDARKTRDIVANDAAQRSAAAASGASGGTALRAVDRLVAVKDAQTVLVPDVRSGVPKAVRVGERLPSGAVLVSADPASGRARTDRGELELQ
jgi:hypothetical protein